MQFEIAVGRRKDSKSWKNQKVTWGDLVERFRSPLNVDITTKAYQKLNNARRGDFKDVGGYVSGYVRSGQRKRENVVYKQIVTLDIDDGTPTMFEDLSEVFEYAFVMHSSFSSTPENPRYRLIVPLCETVTPEEYEPVARYIAGLIDIERFDDTGFQVHRLMYWPAMPKDATYFFSSQDGPFIDPKWVLSQYSDWRDASLWPKAAHANAKLLGEVTKKEDPREKPGTIGLFCQTYSIQDAIETFLPDVYVRHSEGRYTYVGGSTVGGLVIYDDLFAHSHHNTDPICGRTENAFDLVRVHKFGDLDDSPNSKKSLNAMLEFASNDPEVKRTKAANDLAMFVGVDDQDVPGESSSEPNMDWVEELETDKNSKYLSSAKNYELIFQHDPNLSQLFRFNEFEGIPYLMKSRPGREIDHPMPILDVDDAWVRQYVEKMYNIMNMQKVKDAFDLACQKRSYHPIREYLQSLKWDGNNRIDSFLTEYYGVEESEYTKSVMDLVLRAGVGRVYDPGCKFDFMLVLVGEQGSGKSTLAAKLGKEWASDSFTTVKGTAAYEQMDGVWIMEVPELSAMRYAEVEHTKHFISKQNDRYRRAYGVRAETKQRQCIFIGTTNSVMFLRDVTGNRRFLPISVDARCAKRSIWDISEGEIDQLWAEAVLRYEENKNLFLTGKIEIEAKRIQRAHLQVDDRQDGVIEFLDRPLPPDYYDRNAAERQSWHDNYIMGTFDNADQTEWEPRMWVCATEIWVEYMGNRYDQFNRKEQHQITDMLKTIPGWEYRDNQKRTPYGRKRGYKRIGKSIGEKIES